MFTKPLLKFSQRLHLNPSIYYTNIKNEGE